jgi:hypothetical protein
VALSLDHFLLFILATIFNFFVLAIINIQYYV